MSERATEPSTQRELPVHEAARRRAEHLVVDEAGDVVRWRGDTGREVETGLHDYAALYTVPGLYEAVYFLRLGGRAPHLLVEVLAQVVPPGERPDLQVLPPRGLLAVTVAHGFEEEPELAGHGALLLGPAYRERARRRGLGQFTTNGGRFEVAALVLERTEVQQ
ncbi:MAG: hypothetical protein ACRDRH_24270 [Pseudonocardia sp.]